MDLDDPGQNIIPDNKDMPVLRKKTNSEKPYRSSETISKTEMLVDRIG